MKGSKKINPVTNLTAKEEVFVKELVSNGGNKSKAYKVAYDMKDTTKDLECKNSSATGVQITKKPRVSAAIAETRRSVLDSIVLNAKRLTKNMMDIALNPDMPASVRVRATADLLDRAGIVADPSTGNQAITNNIYMEFINRAKTITVDNESVIIDVEQEEQG